MYICRGIGPGQILKTEDSDSDLGAKKSWSGHPSFDIEIIMSSNPVGITVLWFLIKFVLGENLLMQPNVISIDFIVPNEIHFEVCIPPPKKKLANNAPIWFESFSFYNNFIRVHSVQLPIT